MKTNTGLTLIETLVAISILMMAISGALTLAQKSLESSAYAKDQVTAIYLAQEGMELLHNARSRNFVNGSNWLAGLGACTGGACYIDATTGGIAGCGGACPIMRRNTTSGLYGYGSGSGWQDTLYRRNIDMSPIGNEEYLATVTVTWNTGRFARSYQIRETLFNWYE